jgi:hypothetical protein
VGGGVAVVRASSRVVVVVGARCALSFEGGDGRSVVVVRERGAVVRGWEGRRCPRELKGVGRGGRCGSWFEGGGVGVRLWSVGPGFRVSNGKGERALTERTKTTNDDISSSFVVWVPRRYRDVAPGVSTFLHLPIHSLSFMVVAVRLFVMGVRRPGHCCRRGMPR